MTRCDAAFVRAERPGACDSQRPVFIIGMPRSGTSLTEQILASHPAVYGAGEVRFWDRAFAQPGPADASALARLAGEYLAKLGAQAGEKRIREVVTSAGFSRFRRATETPFNIVYEARP